MTAERSRPPVTFDQARSLALVNERAQRLFEDGYRARWIDSTIVEMDSPRGETYGIDTAERTCSCPYFTKAQDMRQDRTCKHLLGLSKLLEKQEAQDWLRDRRLHNQRMWEAMI